MSLDKDYLHSPGSATMEEVLRACFDGKDSGIAALAAGAARDRLCQRPP
jgi:hypothetical protein